MRSATADTELGGRKIAKGACAGYDNRRLGWHRVDAGSREESA
jgi:hypothetical protein